MDFITIATVDATHADVIREALEGAGVTVNVIRLSPFRQLDHLRHQRRPLVDIEVPAPDEQKARATLDLLAIEAQEAALSEAGGSDELVSDDDRRLLDAMRRPPTGPLSPGFGLLLALVFPVAGPIYSGAPRLPFVSAAAHAVGIFIYLISSAHLWYRSDLHVDLGLMVIAAARFLDVVGTVSAVSRHNARLEGATNSETGN